jgi:hypothetical protein
MDYPSHNVRVTPDMLFLSTCLVVAEQLIRFQSIVGTLQSGTRLIERCLSSLWRIYVRRSSANFSVPEATTQVFPVLQPL